MAVRIPKAFADELDIAEGSGVSLHVEADALVVTPSRRPALDLAELLKGVTPENTHAEVDWGPAVGREAWWQE